MEKITLKNQSGRIVWLDFLKVIAIFMMLAVHCTDNVTPAERSDRGITCRAVFTVRSCGLPFRCL